MRLIVNYTTAFLLTSAFTQFGKWYVGYLRPDFATRCLGDDAVPPISYNQSVILTNQQCTRSVEHSIDNGRKSFPSGHASTAMSLCFYFVLYLIYKSTKVASPWVAQLFPIFSLVPLSFGLYTGVCGSINIYMCGWSDY